VLILDLIDSVTHRNKKFLHHIHNLGFFNSMGGVARHGWVVGR
jgi:hypothetical protein